MKRYLLCLLLLTSKAWASSTPLEDFTRRAIQSLPTFHEDRDYADKATQLEAVARAVAEHSKNPPSGIAPRAWAALMLTVAFHESGLSERIQRGDFKPHEADAHKVNGVLMHRARGLWQNHANANNRDTWERANGDVEAQAAMADIGLRRAYFTCSRSGVAWVTATINSNAGLRCGASWPGLDKRIATFNALASR